MKCKLAFFLFAVLAVSVLIGAFAQRSRQRQEMLRARWLEADRRETEYAERAEEARKAKDAVFEKHLREMAKWKNDEKRSIERTLGR